VDAVRGAGRPEATYLLERLVDKAARELGIDRVEIRRKNLIQPNQFPYQTPVALQYDVGDYPATLDMALQAIDYGKYAERKAASESRGKLRGFGISTYIEACGIAPSALVGALGAGAGLYESATVRVHPTGSVSVFTGTHSHGQGHETTFTQIAAAQFGIPSVRPRVPQPRSSRRLGPSCFPFAIAPISLRIPIVTAPLASGSRHGDCPVLAGPSSRSNPRG
jgi:carbon-monoxide dehydrogenase large subunit